MSSEVDSEKGIRERSGEREGSRGRGRAALPSQLEASANSRRSSEARMALHNCPKLGFKGLGLCTLCQPVTEYRFSQGRGGTLGNAALLTWVSHFRKWAAFAGDSCSWGESSSSSRCITTLTPCSTFGTSRCISRRDAYGSSAHMQVKPGSKSLLCHSFQAGCLTFLSLSCFTCQVGRVMVPTSRRLN